MPITNVTHRSETPAETDFRATMGRFRTADPEAGFSFGSKEFSAVEECR
jgi:hypothetical protein